MTVRSRKQMSPIERTTGELVVDSIVTSMLIESVERLVSSG